MKAGSEVNFLALWTHLSRKSLVVQCPFGRSNDAGTKRTRRVRESSQRFTTYRVGGETALRPGRSGDDTYSLVAPIVSERTSTRFAGSTNHDVA